jgi:RsiW-degrading membrane proteinase PrsW (M82 family)
MQPTTERFHWPSLIQLLFSLLGALFLWVFALFLAVMGVMSVMEQASAWEDITLLFLVVASLFLVGGLLLPSAFFALARLMGRPFRSADRYSRLWRPTLLIFFLPLILFAGDQISRVPRFAWMGLPLLHILAIGLPVLWLTYLGRRGLYGGSPQRMWGIFASGLVLGPGLILFLELLAVLLASIPVILILSGDPVFLERLTALAEYVNEYQMLPEEALEELIPYFNQPLLIYAVFAFVAGVVPVIEEALKPVGVWIFAGSISTPSQGFVAGLLSGAGFALFENLMLSTMGDAWAPAVALRIATGLLHIITAGVMGWALALAWLKGRYLRMALTFLTVIFIHGLWNALAILTASADFGLEGVPNLDQVAAAAAVGLAGLAVLMFVIMLASNRSLRRSSSLAEPG